MPSLRLPDPETDVIQIRYIYIVPRDPETGDLSLDTDHGKVRQLGLPDCCGWADVIASWISENTRNISGVFPIMSEKGYTPTFEQFETGPGWGWRVVLYKNIGYNLLKAARGLTSMNCFKF